MSIYSIVRALRLSPFWARYSKAWKLQLIADWPTSTKEI